MYFLLISQPQSVASKICKCASILDSGDEHQHQGSFPSHSGHIYTKSYSKDSTRAEKYLIWLCILIWPRLNPKQVQAVIPALLLSKGNIVHISRFENKDHHYFFSIMVQPILLVGHNNHYTIYIQYNITIWHDEVNCFSVTGLRAFPGVVSYNMSKAALDMLTRYNSFTW